MASASQLSAAAAAPETRSSEIDRLERAVRGLIEERAKLLTENESMREELEAMRGLQERLLLEGQLRREAVRRIDDLVTCIEGLETGSAGSDRARAGSSRGSVESGKAGGK